MYKKALHRMFPVVAILGSRQCGKSTLAKNLYPDWSYYDMENPRDYQLISSDPSAFFAINSSNIIIDEAQQYPELFQVLRGVVDADRKRKGRFLITGSSSPTIAKGISESLAGRIATVEMAPFKQCEWRDAPLPQLYNILAGGADINALLKLEPTVSLQQSMMMWLNGGFPEPLLESEQLTGFYRQWIEQYISDYLHRDIRALFPRLNMQNYQRFLTLLAQFSGQQLNMSTIARAIHTTVATVKDYLDIVHHTFIWRNLPPFTKNRAKKVQKTSKGLFRDSGILHHMLRINDLESLLLHPVAGASFESFVIEEIIRGLQATMATQLAFSYYRTIDRSEIDLIVEGDFGTIPIEIKLASSVRRQSLRALERFLTDTDTPFAILINRGDRIEQLTEKIIQIPVHYL